jgi:c-di-GMP-binding flagellar brake protein YcgR
MAETRMSSTELPKTYWSGAERRRAPRRKLLVQVGCIDANAITFASSEDISETGLLMATAERLEPGTPVTLRFALPALPHAVTIQANATVVRLEERLMIAVKFADLEEEARSAILRFVEDRKQKDAPP